MAAAGSNQHQPKGVTDIVYSNHILQIDWRPAMGFVVAQRNKGTKCYAWVKLLNNCPTEAEAKNTQNKRTAAIFLFVMCSNFSCRCGLRLDSSIRTHQWYEK